MNDAAIGDFYARRQTVSIATEPGAAAQLVEITILADGVRASVERCASCSAQTLTVRGPRYHELPYSCARCGGRIDPTSPDVSGGSA